MKEKPTILVAGGDQRYCWTAAALAEQYPVVTAGLPPESSAAGDLPQCDVLVLPMPVSEDGVHLYAPLSDEKIALAALCRAVRSGGRVFGGRFGSSEALFRAAGLDTADYFVCEELSLRNAVPTAEGALEILLKETSTTLFGSGILVLGFGRVGSRLAQVLTALGAQVTVTSRDYAELARAEMHGCRTMLLEALEARAAEFPILCNTIPARVLHAGILEQLPAETLVLDLASRPGGVEWDAPRQCRCIAALSLPGKTAPAAAGAIIAGTIDHMLKEHGKECFPDD